MSGSVANMRAVVFLLAAFLVVSTTASCTEDEDDWSLNCTGPWTVFGTGVVSFSGHINRCSQPYEVDVTIDYEIVGDSGSASYTMEVANGSSVTVASLIHVELYSVVIEPAYISLSVSVEFATKSYTVGPIDIGQPGTDICSLPSESWCSSERGPCLWEKYKVVIIASTVSGIVVIGLGCGVFVFVQRRRRYKQYRRINS